MIWRTEQGGAIDYDGARGPSDEQVSHRLLALHFALAGVGVLAVRETEVLTDSASAIGKFYN